MLEVEGTSQSLVDIDGEFPARFALELKDAPGEKNYLQPDMTEPRVALALVVATGSDSVSIDPYKGVSGDFRGVSLDHLLLHAAEPVPPTSAWGLTLKLEKELAAGFHIVKVEYEKGCAYADPYAEDETTEPAADDAESTGEEPDESNAWLMDFTSALPLAKEDLQQEINLTLAPLETFLRKGRFPVFDILDPDLLEPFPECEEWEDENEGSWDDGDGDQAGSGIEEEHSE